MATEELEPHEVGSFPPHGDTKQQTSYLFVKSLGKGAFGEAVLYRKTEDNSLVVWKEVDLQRLSEKERRDSQTEIEILSLLNHANIITYYNHFLDNETLLIEMEYANGGSLYEKIAIQTELFKEEVVEWYLFQLLSALSYIHDYSIIHRDIKTMNIFMTKTGLLKLGDFGISRVLESKSQMAETCVGTPYYMSPEIIQGFKYNFKTDIWAIGCVLYEILTLERTFQASNALKLAYSIVRGEHHHTEAIDGKYSESIKDLVNKMLEKEPDNRPSAKQILEGSVFSDKCKDMERKVWELNSASRRQRLSIISSSDLLIPVVKSKVSEVFQWGGGKATPQKLDIFIGGKSAMQVDTGHYHFVTVTVEKELYTWANMQGTSGIVGQLGHGDTAAYKAPKKVDALNGIPIKQAFCGEDFTICLTDEGCVYSFGSDYYGCLGCGEEEGDEVYSPIPVSFFNTIPIAEISAGDCHVVALSKDGDVYTWGSGEFGRLGLGSECDHSSPHKVETPGKHHICHVYAGSDSTFLVTEDGRVMACGSNLHNKLGLYSEASGLRKRQTKVYDIPCICSFSVVKPLSRYNIMSLSAGKTHTAVIDFYGYLYTFGSNKHGQLGVGDFKKRLGICKVRNILSGKKVVGVSCGDEFTVVSTNDNQVYSFGNSENGRLGAVFNEQGSGPNNLCFALPRPIFGTLYSVPYMASRHWHTIVIAEKVANQKTLRSKVSSPKIMFVGGAPFKAVSQLPMTPEHDSAFVSDGASSDVSSEPTGDDCSNPSPSTSRPGSGSVGDRVSSAGSRPSSGAKDESYCPTWLQKEMVESEFIPLQQNANRPSSSSSDTTEKDQEIEILRAKVEALERRNSQLQEVIGEKDDKIQNLEKQVCQYEMILAGVFESLSVWQRECLRIQEDAIQVPVYHEKLPQNVNNPAIHVDSSRCASVHRPVPEISLDHVIGSHIVSSIDDPGYSSRGAIDRSVLENSVPVEHSDVNVPLKGKVSFI